MGKVLKVDFIGAGNVAWNLAPALENAGVSVRHIYSRNTENAKKLANKLYEGIVKEDLDFSECDTDILIIAASDDAIEDIAKEVVLAEHTILAHTSGSTPLNALGYSATKNIGVFYPLQTFTKNQPIDFSALPFLIEGDTENTISTLSNLASMLSSEITVINSNQRKKIHLAAVFASNFTNWMFTQSESILKDAGLDFSIIHALIAQSVNNVIQAGPENAQTGPAKRNDFEVLDAHMEMLINKPDLQNLYKIITQQIVDHYQTDIDE